MDRKIRMKKDGAEIRSRWTTVDLIWLLREKETDTIKNVVF